MKKTLKVLLILAMLCVVAVTLVGCGNDEEKNTGNNEENVNNQDEGKTVEISRGEWKENTYVNDYAGIKFNLPEGWEKYSDEQIAQLMNIGVEALNKGEEEIAEILKQTALYGMVVNDPTTGANVMIMIEKPILTVTPEYYLSNVKQQLEVVESVEYKFDEVYKVKLGNEEYYRLDAVAEVYGISMGQHYFIKAVDDCIVGIIVTTTGEGQIDEIVKCFE